jgi:hypothetical protein
VAARFQNLKSGQSIVQAWKGLELHVRVLKDLDFYESVSTAVIKEQKIVQFCRGGVIRAAQPSAAPGRKAISDDIKNGG